MNCQEVNELMQRYLDRDLEGAEIETMTEHLQHCSACAAMFERLKRLSSELTSLPIIAPPFSLVDAIMPRLDLIDAGKHGGHGTETETAGLLGTVGSTGSSSADGYWKRRFKQRFPFKSVTGVIAAGIVLGIIIVSNNPLSTELADQPLSNYSHSNKSALHDHNSSNNDTTQSITMDHSAADPTATETPRAMNEEAAAAESMGLNKRMDEADQLHKQDEESANNFMMDASPQRVISGDEQYYASIEGQYVIITNLNDERIYVSDEIVADYITGLKWSEDSTHVEYDVIRGEVVEHAIIAVNNQSE